MIVWNEEAILERAIASTHGLADEVVVLDTGSSDGTVALAERLGCRVLTGGDRMHKAKARNQAMKAAGGDWIVILDADERVADPVGLRIFLGETDAQAVYINLCFMGADDQPTLSYQQMRCWQVGAYQYKYRAHEVPIPVDGWGKLAHTNFVWEHRPPRDRAWKLQYTLDRLLMDVEENPDDARPLYYLGRQYRYCERWDEAIGTLTEYLSMPGQDEADAWNDLALCYAQTRQQHQQVKALHQACAAQPGRREWWCALASLYHDQGKEHEAVGLLKCALELPEPANTYHNHYWYGSAIHDLLARCLWKLRRYEEGYGHAKIAFKLSPGDARLHKNLQFFADVMENGGGIPMPVKRKEGCVHVLYLAQRDHANVGYKMMQAVDALDGWQARCVTQFADYFRYPKDVLMPTQTELDELYEWADVVHVLDTWPADVVALGRPVFVTYNGTYYRNNWRTLQKVDAARDIRQLCTTLDLSRHGAKWVPIPVNDVGEAALDDDGLFRVVHCPTRRNVKGTSSVESLGNLPDVVVDIVEGVSNVECLARKAHAHVCVDQFELGYGVNALEAWALGIPVIAGASDEIIDLMKKEIGYLPFVQCEPDELCNTVSRLKSDDVFYQDARQRGIRYIADFHEPGYVATILTDLYGEALRA